MGILACVDQQPVSDPWLARAGDRLITVAAFKRSYLPILLYTDATDTPEVRARVLQNLIDQKLLARQAEREELDTLSALSSLRRSMEKSIITRKLYAEWVRDRLDSIPEEKVQEAFQHSRAKLLVRHLFTNDSVEASRFHDILTRDPAAFNTLARTSFRDTGLAANGGLLGWMSFGEMDPEFEEAAYALQPGEISPPVKTRFGFHILKVDQIQRELLATADDYALARPRLLRILRQREEAELSERVVEDFMTRANLEFDPRVAPMVWQRIATWVGTMSGDMPREQVGNHELPSLRIDLQPLLQEPMLQFAETTWTVSDFLDHLPEMNRQLLFRDLKKGTAFLVRDEILLQEGRRRGLSASREVRAEIQDRVDQALATALLDARAASIHPDTTTLQAYYHLQAVNRYLAPDSLFLEEIRVVELALANTLLQRLRAGEDFHVLAETYTTRKGVRGGRLGWHHAGHPIYPEYSSQLRNQPVKTVLGPLEIPGGYALIRATARRRHTLPFQEIQDRVLADYRVDRIRKLRFYELQKLEKKADITINTDLLYSLDLTEGRSGNPQ